MRRVGRVRALFGLYALGVAVLMFAPLPDTGDALPRDTDKLVHVVVFLGLGAVWYWDRRVDGLPAALVAVLGSAAAAGLVEVIQALLPYRSGDLLDFLAGALGAVVGVLLARRLPLRGRTATSGGPEG